MMRHLYLIFALALLGPTFPGRVLAQDEPPAKGMADGTEDEEEQAAKHFAAGRQLHQEGKYKEAIEELLKAYTLRPAPPILLNIARTYEKLDDKKNALKFYKEFLLKARMVDPNRAKVEAVVKQLEKHVAGKTGAVTSAAGSDTPTAAPTGESDEGGALSSGKQQLIHTPVDSAKVREAITILAELPPQVEADEIVVYFRKAGDIHFLELRMEPQGEAFVVQIPARYITSTSLQYYLEAHKGKGKGATVAFSGAKTTPHIIVIEGGRAPIIGPVKEIEIRSPYRTWFWVSAGTTVAMIGGGVAFAFLARNRQTAMEDWVKNESCKDRCQEGKGAPVLPFDLKARDWESEGQLFATLGKVFFALSAVPAAVTGYLWYKDRSFVKEQRSLLFGQRFPFIAGPWASPDALGFSGRVDF